MKIDTNKVALVLVVILAIALESDMAFVAVDGFFNSWSDMLAEMNNGIRVASNGN